MLPSGKLQLYRVQLKHDYWVLVRRKLFSYSSPVSVFVVTELVVCGNVPRRQVMSSVKQGFLRVAHLNKQPNAHVFEIARVYSSSDLMTNFAQAHSLSS